MQEVENGMMYEDNGYSSMSYDERSSKRRGRNSMNGQYMSRRNVESYNDSGYSNRNYDRGKSGHSIKDRMIDRLERMMDEAGSDYERGEIGKWIERLEVEN